MRRRACTCRWPYRPALSRPGWSSEAAALDLPVVDLDHYRLHPPRPGSEPGLVLGFGNLRSGREDEAVARLAEALRRSG